MKTKRKNIFKSLLALTLALIMVLGVAPLSELAGVDWASLFAPKAEAEEVSDLPESFDLDVYSANIVFRDHESYEYGEFDYLQYCFNTIGSPAGNVYRIFSDNKDFVNSVEAYEAVKKVANPSNVLKDLNLQQRYEAVLYTVLFSSLYGEKLQKVSYSNAISDITGFTDKLINTPRTAVMFNKSSLDPDASDALKDTALAFITDGKDDKWASLSDYNGMVKKVSGSIDKVIGTATDIYNYAQKIGMYCALVDVGADAVRVLLDMKKNTTDIVLKSALQAVADSLSQDWYGVAEKVVLDVGFSVTDKAIKSLVEYGWLGCCEICPFLKGMMIGEKIGTAVCNLLFATDETIEQYEYLKIVTRIEDAAHAGLTKLGNAVDKNNNVVDASSFWFSLDFAATLYEESSNASIEFMYICYTKGLVNKIANFMGAGRDLSAEEFETSINHCNELIQLHYGILRDSWRKYIGDDYPGFLLTLQKREAGFIPITSISVSKKNVTYYVGETAWAPSVTKNPSNANGGIAYKSDNEEVFASTTGFPIDEAKKAGTANVTVYSVDNPSIYDTFTVTVIEKNGETETKTDNGIIDSGTCGSNLTWKLTDGGTLIISGTGAMSEPSSPWSSNSFIKRAIVANGVTTIGSFAFYNCSSLTSVTIGNSVRAIGDFAFDRCTSLTSITIPDSVTSIGESAFARCTSLTSITIPDSVTSIGESAFARCTSLTSITIPDSVTSIGYSAFEYCTGLTSINVASGNNYYSSNNGVLFNKKKTELIRYPEGKSQTSYTIPNSVTSIGKRAFIFCSSLTSITISNSVTSIGVYAFYDCSGLKDVYYAGSEAQWKAISVDGNDSLINATIHYNWTGEHVCTNKKLVTVPAQCEVNGMSYYICTECGKQIGEAAIIPATGHSWGEWQVTKDATATTEGSRERECVACGKKETEVIPILAQTAKDDKSGIEVSAPSGSYNGELELEVEEIFDGESFQIVGTIEGQEQSKIYDVTTKVDGKETQPGATVTVKIPLPEGYDPARTYVYHVNSETGKVENMNARYEDGFLVFETDHFSTYAVVQIKAQKKDSFFKKILNIILAPFRAIINLFKKLFGK